MARIKYEEWNPSEASLALVQTANAICAEYRAQGYDLTLRQLYYQFVARGIIPNNNRSYKNLGSAIDRARRAGLLDWDYIVDRTRNLAGWPHSDDVTTFVEGQVDNYHMDLWSDQKVLVEVWVEKEALAGVIARSANQLDLRYFSCRGYVSQSELHAAAKRHVYWERRGRQVKVIHLGDHDPSGIDMTRDMQDRLELFGASTDVRRIALNFDQVEEYQPPENPAKLTDSRAEGYIERFGDSSWELDALSPEILDGLIQAEVAEWIDLPKWEAREALQQRGRDELQALSDQWDYVVGQLDLPGEDDDDD